MAEGGPEKGAGAGKGKGALEKVAWEGVGGSDMEYLGGDSAPLWAEGWLQGQ